MARGTSRCGLFLIFGLSSIASTIGITSAVLDLVSRVGTQVGTPTPTRTHADTPARAAILYAADARWRGVDKRHPGFVPALSSDSEITD